jgi:NitT/TauT family transport system substrate-binding protein
MGRMKFALACLAAGALAQGASAEPIKIGIVNNSAQAPFYLAVDKGYFAAEGLEATLVPFDAAQPVAVAVVSGDVAFGAVAATGGFYSLAGQGALKIIGGETREVPGFQLFGFVVSNAAYAAGLKSVKDLPGHSVAVTQIGSGYHYALALLAEKYAVDLKSIRILPLQSIPNIASALTGGQADGAMLNATASAPLRERAAVKLVAWSGDETPYQATALFTSTRSPTASTT